MVNGDYLRSSFLWAKMSEMVIKKYKALSADNHMLVILFLTMIFGNKA